jgi:SnoaL-like domain
MGIQGPDVRSYHVLTTMYVRVEPDAVGAEALSTWLYVDCSGDAPAILDMGNYSDTLRKTTEGWKLVTRMVTQGAGTWLER